MVHVSLEDGGVDGSDGVVVVVRESVEELVELHHRVPPVLRHDRLKRAERRQALFTLVPSTSKSAEL